MTSDQSTAEITLNHANHLMPPRTEATRRTRAKRVAAAILVLFVGAGAFAQPVVFNEVMADNKTAYEFKGLFPDWVELYNTSSTTDLTLDGWSITDDAAFPRKYVFPNGTRIDRQSRLIVRCAIPLISEPSDLFTGFGLSDKGETLYLFDSINTNTPHATVTFGPQVADLSIARLPDVAGPFALALPTPSNPNSTEATLGSPAPLKINEWLAAPSGGPDWFELYNPSALPVLVSGLYLSDRTNTASQLTNRAIPTLSFIAALGHLKFDADDNLAQGADHVDFKLSAGGDRIVLFATNKTTVIDRVDFGAQTTGVSMGRLPDGGTNIIFMPGQTPSAPNFGPITSIVINEVLTHTDPPLEDAIELHNVTASPVDISHWWISDEEKTPLKFRVPAGTVIPAGGFKVFYEGVGATVGFNTSGTALEPDFSLSSSKGDDVWLFTGDAAGNLTGYRRSIDFGPSQNGVSFGRVATTDGTDIAPMSARTFGMDAPATLDQFRTGAGKTNAYPKVGPVVINEIMYNPPQVDELLENTLDEFIELYNITDAPVPLFDPAYPTNTWRIRGGPEFNFPTNVTMSPKGFVLVVNFDPATNATQLAAFRALYGVSVDVLIFGGYKSKLNNNADNVELQQPDTPQGEASPTPGLVPYFLVEKVKYKDVAPWPVSADGTGLSMQRSPALRYSNEGTNWFAAPPTASRTNRPAAAPVIAAITPKTVTEGSSLSFAATATDLDLPPQILFFSLGSGAPSGAAITTAGVFTWTPTEAQGPSTNNVLVIVTDTGLPSLRATQAVSIVVIETNSAPVVAAITPKTVNEGALLSFTATATDSDVPAQTRTFSLGAGTPSGASISAAGNFTWTPSEAQGPGNYDILVIATDNGSPSLSATQVVNIVVNESNSAPALAAIEPQTLNVGATLNFTITATDGDVPAQTITYAVVGGPGGASVGAAGVFSWTPTAGQAPSTNVFFVSGTDSGTPGLSATQSFVVVVNAGVACGGVKGDVTGSAFSGWGRGNPDGVVSLLDATLITRLIAGLTNGPLNACEAARMDCGKVVSGGVTNWCGNGSVGLSDASQVARYAAGLDLEFQPMMQNCPPPSGFAPAPKSSRAKDLNLSRTLSLTNATMARGATNCLSFVLNSQGDENGFTFSIHFDTNLLTFVSASRGADATNAPTFLVNTLDLEQGLVGVLCLLPTETSFPAGARVVADLCFQAKAGSETITTPIEFVDSPIAGEVVNAFAENVMAEFQDGEVTLVSGAEFAFTQIVRRPDGAVALKMASPTAGTWQIQSSTNLLDWAPMGSVTNVTGQVEFMDGSATNSEHRFYRALKLEQ